MRIAYDAAPLLNPKTGIGHYAATLLEELLALDESLHFNLFALTMNRSNGIVKSDRVELNHLRMPARIGVTLWEHLRFADRGRLTGNSDVVHGTNFWIPPIASRKGVVTIHDLTFHLYPELCTPQVQRYRWIVPRVLRRCARVIVPTNTVAEQLASELSFPSDRIVVTPEGVRGAFKGASPDPDLAGRLGVYDDYVLFAGTQEPRKNLDRLVEAMGLVELSDLKLLIAGPPGWGSVDLPGWARSLGLSDRVLFSGYLRDEQLASLMAGAKALVFPTLYEGFGLVPLEAMAAGVPVVAAKAGALPETLGDAPFWCDPLDPASIADAIQRAVTDEDARALSIAQGRQQAAAYDWRDTARLTLDAYRSIAAHG